MNKELLFVYGTLKDKDVQKLLFDKELNFIKARLSDWAVFEDDDGYYYISRSKGDVVEGLVLELNIKQLEIADKWEEVPIYNREKVKVIINEPNKKETVWAYTKENYENNKKVSDRTLSKKSKDEVLDEVRKFLGRA